MMARPKDKLGSCLEMTTEAMGKIAAESRRCRRLIDRIVRHIDGNRCGEIVVDFEEGATLHCGEGQTNE